MSKEVFLAQYGETKHIESALKSTDSAVRYAVAKNSGLTSDHMSKILSDKDNWEGHLGLSENGSTPTSIIRKLSKHSDPEVQLNSLLHKNVDPNDIDTALENKSTQPSILNGLVDKSPHITKEQLQGIAYPKKNSRDYHSYTKDRAEERLMKEYPDE